MTTQTDRQALEQARQKGHQQGLEEAKTQLRAFTGISGYWPALYEPEHTSYLAYEIQLTFGLDVWRNHEAARQATVDREIGLVDQTRRAYEDEQQRRDESRGVAGKIIGVALDVMYPEKQHHKSAVANLDRARTSLDQAKERVQEIQLELANVSAWIEQMFAAVDAGRADRHERAERDRIDFDHAQRDVSSRGCQVYTPEEFVAEDSRRLAYEQGNNLVLDGDVYGRDWRRDGDDTSDRGNWTLVWNSKTGETFLEGVGYNVTPAVWLLGRKITTAEKVGEVFDDLLSQMKERNSLAVVLDAYSDA